MSGCKTSPSPFLMGTPLQVDANNNTLGLYSDEEFHSALPAVTILTIFRPENLTKN